MDAEIRGSSPTDDSTLVNLGSRHSHSRYNSFSMPEDGIPQGHRFNPVDLRALEYVGPYDHNLMCAICHCPFVSPVKLDCEHVFCQRCVNLAMRHQDRNLRTCPSCRRRIDQSLMTSAPKILDRILDELLVRCPLRSKGCLEEMPRSRVHDHLGKYCSCAEVNCPAEDCVFTILRKEMDGDCCLHYRIECEDCEQSVMKKDLESHRTLQCEVGRTSCPNCKVQVIVRDFESHIDDCPDAELPCIAALYGCDIIVRRASLVQHLRLCPLAKLTPFLKAQNERLEAQETALKHLRHRTSILDTSFSTIQETLGPSANLSDAPPSLGVADAGPFDATAHHLLCLHESLREEVSRVSAAISEIDGKASMMVMNERLRAKEDLAHTNAAIGSMRLQLQWSMNARLQNQQRVAMIRTQSSGESLENAGSSAAVGPSTGAAMPARRLSDSSRQETKL